MEGAMEKLDTQNCRNNNLIQDIQDRNNQVQDVQIRRLSNAIIRMILQGVYDDTSPLANLRGIPHVLQIIIEHVKNYWKSHIQTGEKEIRAYVPQDGQFAVKLNEISVYSWLGGYVRFPKPSAININMMPFVMSPSFDGCYLPEYLRPYYDKLILEGILENRTDIMDSEMGKVCYLTIQESWIEENTSQRRPGLHTESPGKLIIKNNEKEKETTEENVDLHGDNDENLSECKEKQPYITRGKGSSAKFGGIHGWGISMGYLQGGIYMASTVKNSCKLWDCQILPDQEEDGDIIGKHGDIEHLRNYLPEGEIMEDNVMYWITDRTPHESLPLKSRTYRQWFRLVTSGVSLWFQDHSTKNPLGIVPDPETTKIIKGSKFDETNLVVVCPKTA